MIPHVRWALVIALAVLLTPRSASAWDEDDERPVPLPESEPPPEGEPPSFRPGRHDEWYAYLADPEQRSGAWWESVKYVPLGDHVRLTIGDEIRLRFAETWNDEFGSAELAADPYFRYRQLPYAQLHVGSQLQLFVQLNIAYGIRSEVTKSPSGDETGVEVLQAFGDWTVTLGRGATAMVRAGRHVLAYGSQRLLSVGPNIRTSFDGFLGRFEIGTVHVDGFFGWPVRPRFEPFNDQPDGTRRFWFVYGIVELPDLSRDARIDLEYFGYDDEDKTYADGEGAELRHTAGARFFATLGDWELDFETHLQLGRFAQSDILAWAVALASTHTFSGLPLRPVVQLRANAISGDQRREDGELNTFNAMFESVEYFGDVAAIGPSNLYNLRASVALDVGAGVQVSGVVAPYWRQSLADALYAPGADVARRPDGSQSHSIGTQLEAQVAWQQSRNLDMRAEYIVILPGDFVGETGPAETIHYVLVETVFRY